jgi:hypothetical protein
MAKPVRVSVPVVLPKDEVIYGYSLSYRTLDGQEKKPPRKGDRSQVRVELDTTLPLAELYHPQPDPHRPDHLLFTWKAEDRNLGPKPVSLAWATQAEGPWTPIGDAEMPNTERFSWKMPDDAPNRVYLKLTVRDTAGNVAVAQTDQPVPLVIDICPRDVSEVGLVPWR